MHYKPAQSGNMIQRSTWQSNSSTFFYNRGLRASQAHQDLRPAGPSPPLEASQLTAQRHAGNSGIRWREGGGLSTLLLYCFSLTVPTLVCRVQHARLVQQKIRHYYAITWHLRESFFPHSNDWSASPQNFLSYILKLPRGSLWCLTVGAKTVDDSGALHSIVGKYQGQNFPKVLNATACHNNKDKLSCLYVFRGPSQWIFTFTLTDLCLLQNNQWHLIKIPL